MSDKRTGSEDGPSGQRGLDTVPGTKPPASTDTEQIDTLLSSMGRPLKYDDAHYRHVASVYSLALLVDEWPRQAVTNAFKVTPTQAAKWVSGARRRGFLPPTTQGSRNGRRSEKIRRVAATLGVTPEALVQAVKDEADGDLRLTHQ